MTRAEIPGGTAILRSGAGGDEERSTSASGTIFYSAGASVVSPHDHPPGLEGQVGRFYSFAWVGCDYTYYTPAIPRPVSVAGG